jgi:cytochrome c oxidase subunit 2
MLTHLALTRPEWRRILPIVGVLATVAVLLVSCAGGGAMTDPYSPQPGNEEPPGFFPTTPVTREGVATQNLYTLTFVIAVAVFVIVEGLLLWITFRYRRRRGDDALPAQTHGSNPLEILWTIVPALTVTVLFIGVLTTLNDQDATAAQPPAVTVDVTGFQWQWTFDYPDYGVSGTGAGRVGPVLGVPVDEVIRVRLHSSDVIHSFYVPQLLYKKDVVPGRVNEFSMVVTEPGTYGGQCAEFCGLLHADMHFTMQAMPRPEFDAWIAQQQQQPTPGASQPAPPPGAATVQVTSVSVTAGFDPSDLAAPADQPFTVQLTNADQAAPHDFAIRRGNPDGSDWQGDPDAPAGGSATYNPPPLAAGEYEFYCTIHPNMIGNLQVQ